MKFSLILFQMLAAMPFLFAAETNFYVRNNIRVQRMDSSKAVFSTLEEARDAIRKLKKIAPLPAGGVTVWVESGDYWLPSTFELTEEDSGEKRAPVIYRPLPDADVRLRANYRVNAKLWKPLSAEAGRRAHPKVDRSKLVELDVSNLGLKRVKRFAPGKRFTDQWHIIDLFANDRRQPISQWPNPKEKIGNKGDAGWVTMNGSKNASSFYFGIGGAPADRETSNQLDLDGTRRTERWSNALASGHEIWLKGFWRTSWEPHTMLVAEINSRESWIRLAEQPPGGMGCKYSAVANKEPLWRVGSGKENWFAINLLEEIDQPGEWALDVKEQKIYYYPPAPIGSLEISIADRDSPVIRLKGASGIHLLGFKIDGGMGHGVEIINGRENLIAGCVFTNVGDSSIRLEGGNQNIVQANDISEGGGWGIALHRLGDRGKLIHSETQIRNNHIHHVGRLAFREAIRIERCIGITLSNNLMHDLPKGAVRSDMMNDCLFEYNEVHNIALRESDTGAFYNYGGWSTYGNVWKYNFIHHVNRANGFYSDDGDSGDTYEKNIVQGSINALHFGGGHNNLALNNLFVANKVQSVDDRGIKRGYRAETAYGERLREMNPEAEPWKSYGVRLMRRFGYKSKLWSDVLDPAWKPEYPHGTVMADNVSVASGLFRAPAGRGVEVRNNITLSTVAEAKFDDYAAMDLRTKHAGILAKFPELNEVFPKIGLVIDAHRRKLISRQDSGGLFNRGDDGHAWNEDQMR